MAEEARRQGGARRAALRDFNRQSGYRDSLARGGNFGRDSGRGREDRRHQYRGRTHQRWRGIFSKSCRSCCYVCTCRSCVPGACSSCHRRTVGWGVACRRRARAACSRYRNGGRRNRRSAFAAGPQDGSREQYRSEPGEGHGCRRTDHQAGSGSLSHGSNHWSNHRSNRNGRRSHSRRGACASAQQAPAPVPAACAEPRASSRRQPPAPAPFKRPCRERLPPCASSP